MRAWVTRTKGLDRHTRAFTNSTSIHNVNVPRLSSDATRRSPAKNKTSPIAMAAIPLPSLGENQQCPVHPELSQPSQINKQDSPDVDALAY